MEEPPEEFNSKSKRRNRRGKYERPEHPPAIRPTPDDDRILLEAYRHDVIDATTICSLFPNRSAHKIRGRLLLLYQTEHLDRLPKIEEVHVDGGGSLSTPYILLPKGAERVRAVFNLPVKQKRPKERARRLSAPFIIHDIEQSRFLVSLRQSAEQTDGVEFLYPDEFYRRYAQSILQREHLPRVVRAHVRYQGHSALEGTIPDGLCMLRYTKRAEGQNRRVLFIEIDRGHATIDPTDRYIKTPKFWSGSSILRKLLVYSAFYKRGDYQTEFGIPTFQVLNVTTTSARVRSMQAMFKKRMLHESIPELFLFTDFKSVKTRSGTEIHLPVQDAIGKSHPLAP